MSRTPIREAIRQLEAIGLVEARARRGAVVADLSDRQLDEMFAVMAELEALSARWSAIAMTAAERRHLLALQEDGARLVSAGNREAYVDFNNRFHEAIYRGAHNDFLAELALSVRTRCAPFRRAQFETLGRLAKSHAEHDAVVTAIQRGDADAAATEMRAHIIVVQHGGRCGGRRSGPPARRAGRSGRCGRSRRRAARRQMGQCRISPNLSAQFWLLHTIPPATDGPAGPSAGRMTASPAAGRHPAAKPNPPTSFGESPVPGAGRAPAAVQQRLARRLPREGPAERAMGAPPSCSCLSQGVPGCLSSFFRAASS